MKIDRIVKKNSRDVIIFLDNGEQLFAAREIILKSGLRKNDELTNGQISSLIEENREYFIKQAAFRLLGKRIHSAYELRLKLRGKKYEEKLIDSVINDLIENKYLDDADFAARFTDEKIKTVSWGRMKIEAELRKRKVQPEIISQTLGKIFGNEKQLSAAKKLAEKKLSILLQRGLELKKIKEKLFSFLYSRGYDYETSREVLDSIIIDQADSDFPAT